MTYLIGVAGLLGLTAVYVGLGLADRSRKGCGGCALRSLEDACGTSCSRNRERHVRTEKTRRERGGGRRNGVPHAARSPGGLDGRAPSRRPGPPGHGEGDSRSAADPALPSFPARPGGPEPEARARDGHPSREGGAQEVSMETQLAYCSALDRQVRVAVDAEAGAWPDPGDLDPHELVCLEYGGSCTGTFCPVFRLPVEQMRQNYEKVSNGPLGPKEA